MLDPIYVFNLGGTLCATMSTAGSQEVLQLEEMGNCTAELLAQFVASDELGAILKRTFSGDFAFKKGSPATEICSMCAIAYQNGWNAYADITSGVQQMSVAGVIVSCRENRAFHAEQNSLLAMGHVPPEELRRVLMNIIAVAYRDATNWQPPIQQSTFRTLELARRK